MARNKAGNTSDFGGKTMEIKSNIGSTAEEQKRIDTLIEFMGKYITPEIVYKLKQQGFFTAPASIHHHGHYEGALFDHSYEVAKALVNLTEKMGLKWKNERSPYIVGMFHDLCKMDNYIKAENEEWQYNNATLLPGHGEKSVIIALTLLGELTNEELYCIHWHMGAFDNKDNWNSYGRSCTAYPNVLYTHTADMIAARIVGI